MASGGRGGRGGGAGALKPIGLTYIEGAQLDEVYTQSDISAAPVLSHPQRKSAKLLLSSWM